VEEGEDWYAQFEGSDGGSARPFDYELKIDFDLNSDSANADKDYQSCKEN